MIRTWVEFGKKMVYGRQAVIRGQKWAKQGLQMLKFNISCGKNRSYQKSIFRGFFSGAPINKRRIKRQIKRIWRIDSLMQNN